MSLVIAWPQAALAITCAPFRRVLRSDNLRPAPLDREQAQLLAAFLDVLGPERGA